MTDQNNLPAKASAQNVAAPVEQRGSLVARGLAAVKNSGRLALPQGNDARYRLARTVYDRVRTNWGESRRSEQIAALTEGFTILQQLADAGYGKAYYPLSTFFNGTVFFWDELSVLRNQILAEHFGKQAFDWCFAHQLQDDPEIWSDLGDLYLSDGAGEINNDLAFYWHRKAAEQGYAPAQLSVAWMYQFGQDYELAAYWYQKAAEQGCLDAQIELVVWYEYGRGVDQSDEQSAYWHGKAAEQCADEETLGNMEAGLLGVKDRIEIELRNENTAKAKESSGNTQNYEPKEGESLREWLSTFPKGSKIVSIVLPPKEPAK